MASLIYLITNKTTGRKYVGWTNKSSGLERWKIHVQSARRGQLSHLYNAIRSYGEDDFIVEDIERGEDDDYMLNVREAYHISQYSKEELYNMTNGGEGGITSTSWKIGNVPVNKSKKCPEISQKRKEYWERWKQENPNYKDKWKKYEKVGFSQETRELRKTSAVERNKIKSICPHCNKEGQLVNMKRWHFENCRLNSSKD